MAYLSISTARVSRKVWLNVASIFLNFFAANQSYSLQLFVESLVWKFWLLPSNAQTALNLPSLRAAL